MLYQRLLHCSDVCQSHIINLRKPFGAHVGCAPAHTSHRAVPLAYKKQCPMPNPFDAATQLGPGLRHQFKNPVDQVIIYRPMPAVHYHPATRKELGALLAGPHDMMTPGPGSIPKLLVSPTAVTQAVREASTRNPDAGSPRGDPAQGVTPTNISWKYVRSSSKSYYLR